MIERMLTNFFNSKDKMPQKTNDSLKALTNIFDYNLAIQERPDNDPNIWWNNDYYGINYMLKRYSGYKRAIVSEIEHGPNLDMECGDYEQSASSSILTHSKQRADFLKHKGLKKIFFPIGTSIYYADMIFNDYDRAIIKEYLGRTLLVYPTHDIESYHFIQDTEKFIEYVNEIKKECHYDNVLVSMYFVDIERGQHLRFLKEGWTILSAGRRCNFDFGDVLKSIISLADFAIFQAYTSAIAFCTYMQVPSMIYNQKMTATRRGTDEVVRKFSWDDSAFQQFEELFKDYEDTISKEKYDLCNYYFGYEEIMSPQDLYLLFGFMEELKSVKSQKQILDLASKKKYESIRSRLNEAIEGVFV